MLPATPAPQRPSTLPWLAAFTAVIALFFFEHLFLGRSLMPLDVLDQMLLPREPGARIEVQTHYPIDEITQLAPNAAWWRDSIRRGEFPLWNPHLLGGHPHHGATGWTMLGVFKLPLLVPVSVERAYTLTLVFQFWLAGVLMFALLRELGRSPPAAFLGACAWALCSNFVMFHWLFLNVFPWVPLLLLCWERAVRHGSLAWGTAASFVMALAFLGGSVQMVAYVGFIWGFWALANFDWTTAAGWFRAARWMLGVFGVAALLCAMQWLPTLEFLARETQRLQNLDRGAFGLKHALLGPPATVVMALFPALAGSPQSFDLLKFIKASAIDLNAYIGVVPGVLAVVGGLASRDRRTRNLLWLIAVVLGLIFFTPLQRFLYHRFLLLAVFAGVLLAARGFDAIRDGTVSVVAARRVFLWATYAALALEVALALALLVIRAKGPVLQAKLEAQVRQGAVSNQFGIHVDWLLGRVPRLLDHYRPWNPQFLVPAVALGLAGVFGCRWHSDPNRRHKLMAIVLLASVADLSLTLRDRVPRVDVAEHPWFPLPSVLQPLRGDHDWFRVHRWMPGDRLTLMDNLCWAWGFHQFAGYESMSPDGLSRLPLDETSGFNRLLDLASVKYVITKTNASLPSNRFERVATEHGVCLYKNRTWMPPVTWATNAVFVRNTDEALTRMTLPEFDPTASVVLDSPPTPRVSTPVADLIPRQPRVRVHDRSAQRVAAEVSAPTSGFLVFAETWYPGWTARVDGRDAPVLRANAYMQAVAVDAGLHQIEFQFRPGSFRIGRIVSVSALVAALGVAVVGGRKTLRLESAGR